MRVMNIGAPVLIGALMVFVNSLITHAKVKRDLARIKDQSRERRY